MASPLNYVVTGTSRGIGLEMTKQLLEAGQIVYALARQPSESTPLIELKEKYMDQIHIFPVDVTSDHQVAAFIRDLPKDLVVDVLVNNAGVAGQTAPFGSLSLEQVESTMVNNAIAPMRMTRQLLQFLNRSSNPKVVHISSLMGSIGQNTSGGSYGYRMSKAALNMFNKSFTADYSKITSVVMHPGWVKTDMGGAQAPLSTEDSVRGMLKVIHGLSPRDSGAFYDYKGAELPW